MVIRLGLIPDEVHGCFVGRKEKRCNGFSFSQKDKSGKRKKTEISHGSMLGDCEKEKKGRREKEKGERLEIEM